MTMTPKAAQPGWEAEQMPTPDPDAAFVVLPGHPFHALDDRALLEAIRCEADAALRFSVCEAAYTEHRRRAFEADAILAARLRLYALGHSRSQSR
jgi:hypothetical protein